MREAAFPVRDAPQRRRPAAETRAERAEFYRVRNAEVEYARNLRRIARHIGELVRAFWPLTPARLDALLGALSRYSIALRPWSVVTGERLLADVSRRDARAWNALARRMSVSIRAEIERAPTGEVLRESLARQVDLITSLPTEAAQRVHELTLRGLSTGARASELAKEILRTGEVTASRANLIALTETSRTATELTKARAQYIGSEGYFWRTLHDAEVRKEHRELDGTFHRWDDPPVAAKTGERAHPGCIWRCRCWPEVVLPPPKSGPVAPGGFMKF